MPHIIVETSAGTVSRPQILLDALADCLSGFESVNSSSVKARLMETNHWAGGEGCPGQFIHTTVLFLAGRADDLRSNIADAMVEVVREQFRMDFERGEIAITLEVREADAGTYRK